MRRRDLVASVGAAAAGSLAGCRDLLSSKGPDRRRATTARTRWVDTSVSPPLERVTMRLYDPRRTRRVQRVRVAWDEAAGAVHATGHMVYGSSSCDRPGVERARYDAGRDRLDLRLAPAEREGRSACTADLASTVYRATVAFEGDLPGTIRVVEKHHQGEVDAERTVDRAAQRELCTTDHPEGSDAAATAHWTCPETLVGVGRGSASGNGTRTATGSAPTTGTARPTGSSDG